MYIQLKYNIIFIFKKIHVFLKRYFYIFIVLLTSGLSATRGAVVYFVYKYFFIVHFLLWKLVFMLNSS